MILLSNDRESVLAPSKSPDASGLLVCGNGADRGLGAHSCPNIPSKGLYSLHPCCYWYHYAVSPHWETGVGVGIRRGRRTASRNEKWHWLQVGRASPGIQSEPRFPSQRIRSKIITCKCKHMSMTAGLHSNALQDSGASYWMGAPAPLPHVVASVLILTCLALCCMVRLSCQEVLKCDVKGEEVDSHCFSLYVNIL